MRPSGCFAFHMREVVAPTFTAPGKSFCRTQSMCCRCRFPGAANVSRKLHLTACQTLLKWRGVNWRLTSRNRLHFLVTAWARLSRLNLHVGCGGTTERCLHIYSFRDVVHRNCRSWLGRSMIY